MSIMQEGDRAPIQIGDKVRIRPGFDFHADSLRDKIGTVIGIHDSKMAVDFPGFEYGHDCHSAPISLLRPTTTSKYSGWWLSTTDLECVNEKLQEQEIKPPGFGRYKILMGEEWD